MTVLDARAIQALTEDDINARILELRVKPGFTLLKRDEPLPYVFDLFHDIKEWYEIDSILKGEPHCSGLGAHELRQKAQELGYLIDHPATTSFCTNWAVAGPLLTELYASHRLSVSATDKGIQASCVDAKGYFQVFGDTNPLAAAMRCAIAVYQKEA